MDAMAALLVRDASRFDVIVTTNAFGDILSDEASEIAGSLGLAASINHGDEHGVAQAQHGSAPDIEGQDKANPASLIGSVGDAARLARRAAQRRQSARRAASLIERALEKTIENPQWRTADLGGPLGTKAFGERVTKTVAELAKIDRPMKAILLTRTGDPSVLDYVDVPTPQPKPGEVLVKADTIGVSRPELLVRAGTYKWMPPLPTIPGIEMAGTVAELGEGVSDLEPARRSMSARANCRSAPAATPSTSRCRGARCACCRRMWTSKPRPACPTTRSPTTSSTPRPAACRARSR